MEFSAQQIASVLGGTVEGDPEVKVNNFSKIEEGKPGTLTFWQTQNKNILSTKLKQALF